MSLDRNANSEARLRRNQQRIRSGGATRDIGVSAPLTNSGTKIGLGLLSTGGLQTSGGLLSVKVDNVTIGQDGTGIWVKAVNTSLLTGWGTKGTLQVSSGNLAGTPNPLAAGSSNQVLVPDSTVTSGLKWIDATGLPKLLSQIGSITADTSSLANSTTKTALTPGITIPANTLTVGKTIKIKVGGIYGATAAPTLTLDLWGNYPAIGLDGASFTCAAAGRFYMELNLTCRTTGVSGTLSTGGYITGEFNTSLVQPLGQQTITWDTTAAVTINLVAQWSAANAANTVKGRVLAVEISG